MDVWTPNADPDLVKERKGRPGGQQDHVLKYP